MRGDHQLGQLKRKAILGVGCAHQIADVIYVNNGLDQVTAVGTQTIAHDANGNLQIDGVSTYTHHADNRLTGVSGGASLAYDPIGRLRQITAGGVSGGVAAQPGIGCTPTTKALSSPLPETAA